MFFVLMVLTVFNGFQCFFGVVNSCWTLDNVKPLMTGGGKKKLMYHLVSV